MADYHRHLNAISWIKNAAPETVHFNVVLGRSVIATVNQPMPDRRPSQYTVEIMETGAAEKKLAVREYALPRRLPAACLERHINQDGSFCVGYGLPQNVMYPADIEGACEFWNQLHNFLHGQNMAERSGKWPQGKSWRHGNAADIQRALEDGLEKFHSGIREVSCDRTRLEHALQNRRAPCICGSGRPLNRCCLDLLVLARDFHLEADRLEEKFVREWRHECCGTMESCPLQENAC